MSIIRHDGSVISIGGDFTLRDLPRLLAALHQVVSVKGYQDYTLDFSSCSKAFAGPMMGLVAHAQSSWQSGVDVKLILPIDRALGRLFVNSNWANLIDFRSYGPSEFAGSGQFPAMRFRSAQEQFNSVDNIMKIIFEALTDFSRSDLTALEWSINEITDNVMNHANSPVGGFVQVTNFSKSAKKIQYVVSDPGVGIPGSLRSGRSYIGSDTEALDQSIREGVTRSDAVGQGNGLFGAWRVSEISGGTLCIMSGRASLTSDPERGLHVSSQAVPFSGTLVVSEIPYANPVDLGEAFEFSGKKYQPLDYVDMHFMSDGDGRPIFKLSDEANGFGSRESGKIVRKKMDNLMRLSGGEIVVDCSDVALVSSSFADEVFGMTFKDLGPMQFSSRIRMKNVDKLVGSLIDRAIMQRMRV